MTCRCALFYVLSFVYVLSSAMACDDPEQGREPVERPDAGGFMDAAADLVDMPPPDDLGRMDAGKDAASDLADVSDAGEPDMPAEETCKPPELDPLPELTRYERCAPFVRSGPFVAGVTTLMIEGSPVEVFYPSSVQVDADRARATYDLRAWLPDEARAMIPDDEPTTYEMMAYRDVAIDGSVERPVVIFSHGFAGYRLQSSFLLAHLASWGMVVASAEHPGRGLAAVLTESLSGGQDVAIITGVLDELEALDAAGSGSMFEGALDMERVAMSGHSAGGAAAIELGQAFPDRFATVLGLTPAVKSLQSMEFLPELQGRKFFISGSRDGLTTANDITSYSRMQAPEWRHLVIEGAGHLAFTDICVIGRECGGILKIAEDNGVEVPLLVSILASDGCRRNDLRAEIAWPMINHFAVAELADALGEDLGVGEAYLGEDVGSCFGELTKSYEVNP